jgi:hypothetical protein
MQEVLLHEFLEFFEFPYMSKAGVHVHALSTQIVFLNRIE